ncbi:MAG: hypothetical protein H0W62_11175 [Chitinophagales bacterium]|nr:hypothetical protein [Chitinophagales bacterium]
MENRDARKHQGSIWLGFLLLIVGIGLMLQKAGTPIPNWLFTWKTFLILLGIFIGVRHQFKGAAWLVLILIGGISMIDDVYPSLSLHQFSLPVIIIAVGLWLIIRPKNYRHWDQESMKWKNARPPINSGEDYLDTTSVFGGVRKIILSKDFKGGDVTSFMGGTELDLTQADINGRVTLDVTSILGGTKLILPTNWDVRSELVSVFGGIEDKRPRESITVNPDKVLVLKGTCFLGGIDIRSF